MNKIYGKYFFNQLSLDLGKMFDDVKCFNVNSTLTMMYWHIGHRINQDVLDNQRAEYGKQIVSTLSTKLTWSHILEILPSKEVLHKQIQKSLEAAKALRDNSIEEA